MGGWVWNAHAGWCEGNIRDRDRGGGSSTQVLAFVSIRSPDEVKNISQLTLSGRG